MPGLRVRMSMTSTQESPIDSESEKKVPSEELSDDDRDGERDTMLENGHLQELEVDLGAIVKEEGMCWAIQC
jgi:hypothetical protein